MTPETILIFFISYVLLHIKPGPGQTFRIGCALDKGFTCALSVTVGVSVICTIYFLIVALSYNSLISYMASLAPIFKVLGGVYLIYLGGSGFFKNQSKTADSYSHNTTINDTKNILKFFAIGLALSLSNPMDIVYFLSVLPNLIPIGELTQSDLIIGASIVFFTGIIIDIMILTVVVMAKESFMNEKLTTYISITANAVFILIGIFFIYSAFFLDEYPLKLV